MEQHIFVNGVKISVDPYDLVAVATDLQFAHDGPWMSQLRWDRGSRRFYLARGRPKVELPVPGVTTDVRLSLDPEDTRHLVTSARFAYSYASERGVTVETVNEVTGERPPCFDKTADREFDGNFSPYADSDGMKWHDVGGDADDADCLRGSRR